MTQTILITGAAIRIGRELALHFAAQGWQVAAHYNRSVSEAQLLKQESGGRIALFQQDLSEGDAADRLFAAVQSHVGEVQVLINNASLFERDDSTPQAKMLHYAVNMAAPVRLTELLAARKIPGAAAINMLDASLDASREKLSAYAGSKEELEHWTMNAAPRLKGSLRLYGVKIGPTLRNPRESQEHFDRAAATTKSRRPTKLSDIIATIEKCISDTSCSLNAIHDLS